MLNKEWLAWAKKYWTTATAWHSNKFLNPKKDEAVLPIIHLNGYKINNLTIYITMEKKRNIKLFKDLNVIKIKRLK